MRSWLLLFLLLPLALHAETYYVRQHGSDAADGKTPKTAFATVLRGAQALQNADTLVIGPGAYTANAFMADRCGAGDAAFAITGDESGKLTGDPAGAVVVAPQVAGEPALSFYRCISLAISGLTFRGTGQGIMLEKCQTIGVQQCTFDGLSRGVAVDGCKTVYIMTSVISGCTLGIFIKSSSKGSWRS